MRGFSLRQQFAVIGAHQFISEVDYRLADIFQLRTHDYLIIVTDGRFVPAAGIDHSYEASIVLFHIAIGKAELAEQFNASDLEPDEMIGMINHAHLIGLGVANPQAGFGGCGMVIAVHSPLQRGFRFSRNDVTPSRKSAV